MKDYFYIINNDFLKKLKLNDDDSVINISTIRYKKDKQLIDDIINKKSYKYLNENGNYKIPLKTFAALRFDYMAKMGKYIVEKPNLKIHKKIIYAFSVHIDQYKSIIEDLKEVFKNQEIAVHLKIHPLYKIHELEKKIKLPTNFKFITNIDTDILKDSYDFILFNDNSFGIEALLQGVKSYQYDKNGKLIRQITKGNWDVTAVYGGCCGGSFRKVYIQTKSSGWFSHSTMIKGSDGAAYLMDTIQSALNSK